MKLIDTINIPYVFNKIPIINESEDWIYSSLGSIILNMYYVKVKNIDPMITETKKNKDYLEDAQNKRQFDGLFRILSELLMKFHETCNYSNYQNFSYNLTFLLFEKRNISLYRYVDSVYKDWGIGAWSAQSIIEDLNLRYTENETFYNNINLNNDDIIIAQNFLNFIEACEIFFDYVRGLEDSETIDYANKSGYDKELNYLISYINNILKMDLVYNELKWDILKHLANINKDYILKQDSKISNLRYKVFNREILGSYFV